MTGDTVPQQIPLAQVPSPAVQMPDPDLRQAFEDEVAERLGILPNFFRSTTASPELLRSLWVFTRAGYLDSPMPSIFKERLFVWLSRFCPMRYCIVRHVGFLLGGGHGRPAGDAAAAGQSIEQVVDLLRQPSPWTRDMRPVYTLLEVLCAPLDDWPEAGSTIEDAIFACAAVLFVDPARGARARNVLRRGLGDRRFEFFCGYLAFIRTAHYWTVLHPEIEIEEDMRALMRTHEELERLLLHDPEGGRAQMGELMNARRALEDKDRQKDSFIAVLAHELRNPLGAIRAASDAMSLLPLQEPRAWRLIERMNRQTTAMARILDDLLDASRIALGKVAVHPEPIRLPELIRDVLDEHQARVEEAGLRLTARYTMRASQVMADRVRLRQIVDNLMSNAVKFTPKGGTIRIMVAEEGLQAVVSVQDSGIGFEPEFAKRMFEPFTQQEQGSDRTQGGLGLGLAIATRLAALQKGSLSASSEGLGKGALFTLRMPIAPASVAPQAAERSAAVPISQKVLLVEDNKDVADSVAELLQLVGYQVSVAHDGPTAVAAALEAIPDLILCDVGLPGSMDGFAVARACRADARLQGTRLIAVSGYSAPKDHEAAVDAGFERLMAKPLTREALAEIGRGARPSR
jgi:signal transduction histidine kinase/CheY-like chemotaxis protein